MSISLKAQLVQEITYHVPSFDRKYYDKAHDSGATRKIGKLSGTRMFYDFYAMDQLWRTVGSGKYPKELRKMQKGMPEDDPEKYYHTLNKPGAKGTFNVAGDIAPEAVAKVVDKIHDEVVRGVAKNLINYLHMAVVMEFQHLVSQSDGWQLFRRGIVTKYNKTQKITKEEFQKLIEQYIPRLKDHPNTVKRLLKFSKYFSEMNTSDDKDPFDVVRPYTNKTEEPEPSTSTEPETPEKELPEPEPYQMPGEPDTTDYNAEPEEPEAGTAEYEPETNPDITPYKSHYSDYDPEDVYYKNKKKKGTDALNEILITEEEINTHKIQNVYSAIHKSGVTFDDIALSYNNIDWGGSYGGPKWGEAAVSLLKLMQSKKSMDTEEYVDIIDHIYDLQHNTGSLLNKGPMVITDTDLNRRYRITHPARFLPFVSPIIQQLLTRYLKYFPGTDVEKEISKGKLLIAPSIPMTPEEITYLKSIGFFEESSGLMRAPVKFVKVRADKTPEQIDLSYYVKKCNEGNYLVYDQFNSDVQLFNSFQDTQKYIDSHIKKDIKSSSINLPPPAAPSISEKQKYINSHIKVKLPADKEKMLLDHCKMGWRSKSDSQYYKAYLPGGKRFMLFAFNDGSYMAATNDTNVFQVYTDWGIAFQFCQSMTITAEPYPDMPGALAAIGNNISPTVVDPKVTGNIGKPSDKTTKYYLESTEVADLFNFTKTSSTVVSIIEDADGMYLVYTIGANYFKVGKKVDSMMGKPYKVIHFMGFDTDTPEEWLFVTWEITFQFIQTEWVNLLKPDKISIKSLFIPHAIPPSTLAGTMMGATTAAQLPPNAASTAAYNFHAGITTPPKNSMRLTVEDEKKLADLGFHPIMSNGDVLYVHVKSQDIVKFYANNKARFLFGNKAMIAMPTANPIINLSIPDMFVWIQKHIEPGIAHPGTLASNKVGMIFEKPILAAGFIWYPAKGQYINNTNGDIVTVAPYPKSTVELSNGSTYKFKDLPALATFLKTDYLNLSKKKVTDTTLGVTNNQLDKVTNILQEYGFKYIGFHGAESIWNFENKPLSASITISSTGDVKFLYLGSTHDVSNITTPEGMNELKSFVKSEFTKLKPSNEGIANELSSLLISQGYIDPHTLTVKPHNKIDAIKSFRNFIMDKLGIDSADVALSSSKYAIEMFPQFIEYVKQNGVPPLDNNNNLLSLLKNIKPSTPSPAPAPAAAKNPVAGEVLSGNIINHLSDKIEKLADTAGFTKGMNSLGTLWDNLNGFSFQVFTDGVGFKKQSSTGYSYQQQTKNIPYANLNDYLTNVLSKIRPMMGNEKIEQLFLNTPTSKEMDTLDEFTPSGEKYQSSGVPEARISLNIHDETLLEKCGFEWEVKTLGYRNKKQPFSDTIVFYNNGTTEFIEENGSYKYTTEEHHDIPTMLKFIVLKYKNNPVKKDDNAATALPTAAEIDQVMKKLGFTYNTIPGHDPAQSISYDTAEKDKVFYIYPNGKVVFAYNQPGLFGPDKPYWQNYTFNNWSEFMEYVNGKSKANLPSLPVISEKTKMPFSRYDYISAFNTLPPNMTIRLVAEDEDTLKKVGFKYTGDKNPGDDHIIICYKRKADKMYFYAGGIASYWATPEKETKIFDSIKEGMEYLWRQFGGSAVKENMYKSIMEAMYF